MNSQEEPALQDKVVNVETGHLDEESQGETDRHMVTATGDEEVEHNVIPHVGRFAITTRDKSLSYNIHLIKSEPISTHNMPKVLSDIGFHSPSQIVSTPFSTAESSRFEYPFPDVSTSSSESNSPKLGPFTPSPDSLRFSQIIQPAHASPRNSFQLPPSVPKHASTHPKLHSPPAPVPPGLKQKLQRWSLGLLRRRSISEKQSKEGSSQESAPSPVPAKSGSTRSSGETVTGDRLRKSSSSASRITPSVPG